MDAEPESPKQLQSGNMCQALKHGGRPYEEGVVV